MENNNQKNKFYWVYLIGFFLIASLPLFAAPPLLHPAPWGKTVLFRIIFSIIIFFFTYQLIHQKNTPLFKNLAPRAVRLILGILALLFSLFTLSTIFSQDISFSFWGSPWRAGGFLTFSFYIIFAILTFLIIKDRDWKKIWNFSIFIGVLITIFGVGQYFKLFSGFIVSSDVGVPSTMGNSSLLAIYLSLLFFLTLALGLKEKSILKKVFYFLSIFLFVFGIFISGARSTYLGIIIGLFFFFFFYPKKMPRLKIITGGLLLLSVLAVFYFNSSPTPPNFVKNNATSSRIFSYLSTRASFKTAIGDLVGARFSTWSIGLQAIKEKPIFGWGPENFSIAFDKYYNPSLPQIAGLWWDRAHNFFIEYASTSGIPFLTTYLLLIGVLFWQLQILKKSHNPGETVSNQRSVIVHGIQATLIAYLISIFFTFDDIDTYLVFFLLVGYCLHLISSAQKPSPLNQNNPKNNTSLLPSILYKWRKSIIFFLFILLLIFFWSYNLKPLLINAETNWAEYYSTNGNCQKATDKMEKVLPSHSIIDEYVRLQYLDVLKNCQALNPKQGDGLFIQKNIQILEEAAKLRPTYTRTWLLLGSYYDLFISNNPDMRTEDKENLLIKSDACFKKASELSPKRQEVLLAWSNNFLLWGKYNEAKEKSEQCIKVNTNLGGCYWQKALSDILLGNLTEAKENMETAKQKQFSVYSSSEYLSQTLTVYLMAIKNLKVVDIEYYKSLAEIYSGLTVAYPKNSQYHASLSYVYKTIGEYEKAGEEAIKVFELQPENKAEVEKFIKSLIPFDPNNPALRFSLVSLYTQTGQTEKAKNELSIIKYLYLQLIRNNPENDDYHFSLAHIYRGLGEYDNARKEAMLVVKYSPGSKQKVEDFLKTLPY